MRQSKIGSRCSGGIEKWRKVINKEKIRKRLRNRREEKKERETEEKG